ncbi:hypothetical protein [Flavobacterium sp. 5]|uniref:hypothetical protein n=1 Tax=Flavobacterium sp. 5 TaxID=2035199 RepID=UPI000C2B8653|nr:hypothetical protein [Flavobacterium sp. 5]PKB15878.1 hypothetical protein CLU82_0981 [Flavobacterium sp. 5]
MKKILFLFSTLTLVLIYSCSNDEKNDSETSDTSSVLLKKVISKDDDSELITTFTYDGKKLTTVNFSDGDLYSFTYTGDLITKIEYFEKNVLSEKDLYTYDSQGNLVTVINIEGNYAHRTEYTRNSDGTISYDGYYGDATSQTMFSTKGKLYFLNSEIIKDESSDIQGSTTYEDVVTYIYDTKNNPYKNITGFDKIMISESSDFFDDLEGGISHNLLKEEWTSFNKSEETTSCTYTYESNGFPKTSIVDGTSFQYFY